MQYAWVSHPCGPTASRISRRERGMQGTSLHSPAPGRVKACWLGLQPGDHASRGACWRDTWEGCKGDKSRRRHGGLTWRSRPPLAARRQHFRAGQRRSPHLWISQTLDSDTHTATGRCTVLAMLRLCAAAVLCLAIGLSNAAPDLLVLDRQAERAGRQRGA